MMLATALALLLRAPVDEAALSQAEAHGFAGDAYVKRATTTAARPLDDLQKAHTAYDSAYMIADATLYLCRAADVADLALRTAGFADEHERRSWEDTRADDLERLREHALATGRANCRYAATGQPAPPQAPPVTDDPARPPAQTLTAAAPPSLAPPRRPATDRAQLHRSRAHTAMGAVLTGAGLGMLGAVAGVLDLRRQRADDMRVLITTVETEGRLFSPTETQRYFHLVDELHRNKAAAIGVGVVGAVSFSAGVALLATRKHTRARSYALRPYGGPHGVGATLRLRF